MSTPGISRSVQPSLRRVKHGLEDPLVYNDFSKCRRLMKTVVGMMTRGTDLQPVFSGIVKVLGHQDIVVKKLACHCLIQYADRQHDLVVLGVNTLLKDCVDPNPLIRGLAIKSLCSLRQSNLLDYAIKPIEQALQDRSAYVRRAAVMGCVKLNHTDPQLLEDHGFIETLYALIRDDDPIVVVNCLSALEDILDGEGGIVVNHHIANHLLNRISQFSDWGLVIILKLLQKYKTKTEQEVFGVMDVCDPLLKHNNSAVVVESFHLLMHLVSDKSHLTSEVVKRASGPITSFLSSDNSELSCLILDIVEDMTLHFKDILTSKYSVLFCRYNEPSYVKVRKIRLLAQVVNEDNVSEVIEELGMYCTDISPQLVEVSVSALSTIAQSLPTSFENCITKLFTLLKLHQEHITSEVLKSLQKLNLGQLDHLHEFLSLLPRSIETVKNASGQSALLWLIGEYGELIDDSPYIIEDFIDSGLEERDCGVMLSLLTTTMKLFLKRPAECQDMLGRLLESCTQDTNKCISDYATTYCCLLKGNIEFAKAVICNENVPT